MRALAIAATGMNAQQLNVEVIANNISNVNTTAFKAARAEFTDLLYQTVRHRSKCCARAIHRIHLDCLLRKFCQSLVRWSTVH